MPISRYQIRNVYSLADPELYKAADKDDPEALLEGVAMSGLVGVLRQLGDLAEFAAEIFHELHEEVMATAARSHGILVRVQQLELEIPSIERAFLSQTCHSPFFPNSGVDWHPNRQTAQNLITTGDLPRFVMDCYEDCRGPPRLFLLDKFDVGGAGACLKRYTDPSFYKVEASLHEFESDETQRDKKIRKMKKKISQLNGGETPEVSPASRVKLHQLFLEEQVQTGAAEPARLVKLKKRPNKFAFESESGESYMNKFLNSSLEDRLVHEVPIGLTLPSNNSNGSRLEILEDSTLSSTLGWVIQSRSPCAASSSLEEPVCGDPTSRLEILQDSMMGSASGLAMQSRSPYVASSSVEETVCGDLASTLETFEDSTVGSALGSVMQCKSSCVASSSVEETVCGDPTSRVGVLEDDMVGFAMGLAVQGRSPCVASSSVEEAICGNPTDNLSAERQASELPSLVEEEVDEKQITVDEEIKTDGLQNGDLSDAVVSETDDYVDAFGTMESELETDAKLRSNTDPTIDKRIYSDTNIDQLRSQSTGNLTASDDGNHLPRKRKTNYLESDTTSTSNEYTPSVGVSSPPRPFACVEIPFHPRVPPKQVSSIAENIPVPDQDITNDVCVDVIKLPDVSSAINSALLVDQVVILEEGTSKEEYSNEVEEILTSRRKKVEHEQDLEVNVDGHSTSSFVISSAGDAVNKHLDGTIHRISENTSSRVEECAANTNSPGSVISRCSSPDSVISHADEQCFDPSLAKHDVHDLDVDASDTDDIHVAEVTADNPPEIYSLPEEHLKKIGDDNVLYTSDSAEATVVSYSIKGDETEESNNTKFQPATGMVSDLADANRSRGNEVSVCKDETTLEEREIESLNSEIIGGNHACIPDHVNRNDVGIDLSMLDNDAELERREAYSFNSEMEKSDDVIAVDANINEDDDRSERDGQSVMSQLCIIQDSKESGEKQEEDQLLVISPDSNYVPCVDDSSNLNKLLFDSIPDASMASDDLNGSPPSLNSKILKEQTHSPVAETEDPNELQQIVSRQSEDVAPCGDLANVGLLDAPDPNVCTKAEHGHDQIDIFEAADSSPMEDKVDRPNDQLHPASQLNFLTNVDHETHFDDDDDTQSKPSYPVNLSSQSVVLQEEYLQQKPMLELLQASSHDINLSNQVRHQSIPVFPGLGILPQSAPVQLEDVPPLPPLPPMQWRMRNLPNSLLTPIDGGQHSRNHCPPIVPSMADEGPQMVGLPTLDESRNSDTKNQKSQHGGYEDLRVDVGSFSPTVIPVASSHSEDHAKLSASSEASFAENFVPQAASKTEHSRTIPTTSGQGIFWPSSNPYSIPPAEEMATSIQPMKIQLRSPLIDAVDAHGNASESSEEDGSFDRMVLPEATLHTEDQIKPSASSEASFAENLVPQAATYTEHSRRILAAENLMPHSIPLADEMSTSTRPMKLQRPRSPLIDAVAAHDKSKLRKVSDLATPQIPKGEEIDNLLEQIRAKSFNLKPAVQTRPSIRGPTTNLRVAAILEKANAIRQAFVGSDDDDDDSDGWSDS